MLKQLFLCLLAINYITAQGGCEKGCLRCVQSTTDSTIFSCRIYDALEKYYFDQQSNSIKKSTKENCTMVDSTGKCMVCSTNFFPDSTTGNCTQVTTPITNCMSYNISGCEMCSTGFFLENNACIAVPTTITNCHQYNKIGGVYTCKTCQNDYYTSKDNKTCIALPEISNCMDFSIYKCMTCNQGYIYNSDLVYDSMVAGIANQTSNNINNLIMEFQQNNQKIEVQALCEVHSVTNCLVYVDAHTCQTCASGYYLNGKICEKNPDLMITNCLKYQDLQICNECNFNFYLANDKKSCISIDSNGITNCLEYDGSQSSIQCKKCNQNFYVSNNTCQSLSTVANCQTYQDKENKCMTCNSNYLLNAQRDGCAQMDSSCSTYLNNFSQSDVQDSNAAPKDFKATCDTCPSGTKKASDNKSCVNNSISNCADENTDGTNCNECNSTFKKTAATTCQENGFQNVSECLTLAGQTKYECKVCQDKHFRANIIKACKEYQSIANCMTYNFGNNERTCATCNIGYFQTNNNTECTLIQDSNSQVITDCAYVDANNNQRCGQCMDGKTLVNSTDNGVTLTCIDPLENYLKDCQLLKTPGVNDKTLALQKCDWCKEDFYPLVITDSYYCINDKFLKSFYENITTATGCIRYGRDEKCLRCISGKYLANDRLTCVDTCEFGFHAMMEVNTGAGNELSHNICLANVAPATDQGDMRLGNVAPLVNYKGTAILQHMPNSCMAISGKTILKIFTNKAVVIATQNDLDALKHEDLQGLNTPIGYTNYKKDFNASTTEWVFNPNDFWPSIQCHELVAADKINGLDDANKGTNLSAYNTSCEYYWQKASGDLICLRCPDNQVASTIKMEGAYSYLHSCSSDSNCSQGNWSGVPAYWKKFLSCNRCQVSSNLDYIPLIVFEGDSTTANDGWKFSQWRQFTLHSDLQFLTVDEANSRPSDKNILCLNNTDNTSIQTFFHQSTTANTNLVKMTNCGIAFMNINLHGTSSLANNHDFTNTGIKNKDWNHTAFDPANEDQHILCAACKPGYAPVHYTDNTPFVSSCTVINNCDTSLNTIYNICAKCATNFIHEWDATNSKVNYASCVSFNNTNNANCIAADSAADCKRCAPGYHLNPDKICVLIKASFCANETWVIHDYTNYTPDELYSFQNPMGCKDACINGYTALPLINNQDNTICVTDTWFSSAILIDQTLTTAYANISFCKFYSYDSVNGYKCHECKTNYVIQQNGLKCQPNNNLVNCKIAQNNSSSSCYECVSSSGMYKSSGNFKCGSNTILNCKTVESMANNINNSTTVKCTECKDDYYLASNTCKIGKIQNCIKYKSVTDSNILSGNSEYNHDKCIECKSGYTGAYYSNNDYFNYCVKKNSRLLCKSAKFELSGNTINYTCTTCEQPNYELITINDNTPDRLQKDCFEVTQVPNCETYSTTYSLTKNAFQCTSCLPDYYLSDNICVLRTHKDANCNTYQVSLDECQVCKDLYYLNQAKTACIANPIGVEGCVEFTDSLNCKVCGSNLLLSSNQCKAVTPINNCALYSSATACQTCQPFYYLVTQNNATICQQNLANCKIQNEANVCVECKYQYRLKTVNNISECESFSIEKCNVYDVNNGECLECESKYYVNPNDKTQCAEVPVGNQINNCLVYSNATDCKKCTTNTALSTDKKSCDNIGNFDVNCIEINELSQAQCVACKFGTYFQNNQCQEINNFKISDGCFLADLNSSPNKCLVCATKYHMNSSGNCTLNDPVVTPPTTPSSRILLSLLSLVVFMF